MRRLLLAGVLAFCSLIALPVLAEPPADHGSGVQAMPPATSAPASDLQAAQIMVQQHPDRASAWNTLARALAKDDPQQARQHFEHALSLDPNYVGSLLGLAVLNLNIFREPDKAAGYATRVLELQPDNAMALRQLARIEREQSTGRSAGAASPDH